MLGLVFALPIEMSLLKVQLKGVEGLEEYTSGGFYPGSLEGTPVVLATAGIGPERAERATKRLLSASGGFRIKTVLSLGYAGALKEGVKTGELVVVSNVLYGSWKGGPDGLISYPCHSFLTEVSRKTAEENGFKTCLGDLLTVVDPIKRPEDKRQAGLLTGAVAVDMESAGVAAAAREAQVPFMALKVILDEVDEELKGTGLVDEEGRVKLFTTFIYLLSHPWDIIYLKRLNRQAEQATGELTRFLPALAKKVSEGQISLTEG